MSLTFIETAKLPRMPSTGQGEVTEILSEALCGAKNGRGMLRWLKLGEAFSPEAGDRHQLVYLMAGKGTITLDGKAYDVARGAGIYLGPAETATIEANQGAEMKLFHLMVPKAKK
jgi:quercetin dioxygenase-like cupin family protein